MTGDSTYIGRKPAGPKDELELLVRFGQALLKGRTLAPDDRNVVYAVAELLDRANYVLESTVDLTIMGGDRGVFLNGTPHALPKDKRDLQDELTRGMPARGLAGITIGGPLDANEVNAFLAAWRLPPVGSPRDSLHRLNEAWSGERAGRGLQDPGPLQLVKLTAAGEMPLPKTLPAPVAAADDDDDYSPPGEDEGMDAQQAALAKLARRSKEQSEKAAPAATNEPGGATAVKKAGDVIPEDLAKATPSDSDSGDGSREKATPWDSRTGDTSGSRSGEPTPKSPSWLSGEVEAPSSWVTAAEESTGGSRSGEDAPSSGKRDTTEFKNVAEAFEQAAEVAERSASSTAVRPPGAPVPGQSRAFSDSRIASVADDEGGSTAVRRSSEVIDEDREGARTASREGPADVEEVGSGTTFAAEDPGRSVDELSIGQDPGRSIDELAIGQDPGRSVDELAIDPSKTPVRLGAPEAPKVEDLTPEASRALAAYARLQARAFAALTAPTSGRDRAVLALRRTVVEILQGLASTAFEDRLLALTAVPSGADDARALHAANTAILAALSGRACGLPKIEMADLALAAALHDDGDVEAAGKPDVWPRCLQRALEGTLSDASLLRAIVAYERAGAPGVVARPAPQQSKPRLESRIVACACAFDSTTRGTEQRAAAAPDLAIQRLAPAGHDPIAVKGLTAALGKYPRGLLVSLEPKGDLAVVLACGGRRNDRPRVRIVADRNGQSIPAREIELGSARDLSVARIESAAKVAIEPLPHLLAWG